jgi:RNA polymerase sigma-70 factor (ECF subfamily)
MKRNEREPHYLIGQGVGASVTMIIAFRKHVVYLRGFDDAFIDRLRLGDAATEREFASYFSELIRIKVRSRLRDSALVEDVTQETFLRVLRVLRSPEGLRNAGCLGAFVNSVCNNVLHEALRTKVRHRTPTEDERHLIPDETTPGPEDRVLAEERREIVRSVLDRLSTRDRAVLQAVFLEEKQKDEVCAQLGVGRDYLRVLLHRAKSQFRACLAQSPAGSRGARAERSAPAARPLGG